jgi:hypothetical protein
MPASAVIAITVSCTIVAVALYHYASRLLALSAERRLRALKSQEDLIAALSAFNVAAGQISKSVDGFDEMPKFMAGLVRVCEAFVIEVAKHRKAAEQLAALIAGGQDQKNSFQGDGEDEKAAHFRELEKIVGGLTPEQAAAAVAAEDEKKSIYGNSDLGPSAL